MPSEEYSRDDDSGQPQAAGRTDDSAAGSPIIVFRPSRWRVLMVLFATFLPVLLCYEVIAYGVLGWRDWDNSLFSCIFFLAMLGVSTWRAPDGCALYVSDTEISDSWERTIRLADLDRIRSAKRSLYDRFNGRQRLYSTNGTRINWQRAWFDGSDLRELLDLLHLDQGSTR